MDELRAKAGTLKDTIGDVSEEIKVMASDTPNLDVFNDVIGLSGDALSAYSSSFFLVASASLYSSFSFSVALLVLDEKAYKAVATPKAAVASST